MKVKQKFFENLKFFSEVILEKNHIRVNDIVKCPVCGCESYQVMHEIKRGGVVVAIHYRDKTITEAFKPLLHYSHLQDHQSFLCPECGMDLMPSLSGETGECVGIFIKKRNE